MVQVGIHTIGTLRVGMKIILNYRYWRFSRYRKNSFWSFPYFMKSRNFWEWGCHGSLLGEFYGMKGRKKKQHRDHSHLGKQMSSQTLGSCLLPRNPCVLPTEACLPASSPLFRYIIPNLSHLGSYSFGELQMYMNNCFFPPINLSIVS